MRRNINKTLSQQGAHYSRSEILLSWQSRQRFSRLLSLWTLLRVVTAIMIIRYSLFGGFTLLNKLDKIRESWLFTGWTASKFGSSPEIYRARSLTFMPNVYYFPLNLYWPALKRNQPELPWQALCKTCEGSLSEKLKERKQVVVKPLDIWRCSPLSASKLVTFTEDANHHKMCVDHYARK